MSTTTTPTTHPERAAVDLALHHLRQFHTRLTRKAMRLGEMGYTPAAESAANALADAHAAITALEAVGGGEELGR